MKPINQQPVALQSRLPDEDLIFFFTHRELGQLLHARSGRLIKQYVNSWLIVACTLNGTLCADR